MTDEEADDLYGKLLAELRRRRDDEKPGERDDYLKAIEAEIGAGKPVQVTLKVPTEATISDPIAGTRKGDAASSGEFIQRQEYRAKEKLKILIDGLALATVAPPLMASRFAAMVARLNANVDTLGLQMSDDQTTAARRSLEIRTITADVNAIAALRALLKEVQRELSDRPPTFVSFDTEPT